ncbi:hypothetical protein KKG56_06650 [bacterium]|nr:hypothetical protein [bacterium]
MNQQRVTTLDLINLLILYFLCLIVVCPVCSAEEKLQLSLLKLSIDEKILRPLPLKPAASPVAAPKKESSTMPFQTLRNDAESLVKPMSIKEKEEVLPLKESISFPEIPGSISYQPKFEINKEKWEEVRNSVEKARQIHTEEKSVVKTETGDTGEVGSGQEAGDSEGVEKAGDTVEVRRLREKIAQEEKKRFEEEQRCIKEELQRLREGTKDKKQEKQPDVIVDDVPEVDGFKPQIGEMPAVGVGSKPTLFFGHEGTEAQREKEVGNGKWKTENGKGEGQSAVSSKQEAGDKKQEAGVGVLPSTAVDKEKRLHRFMDVPKNIINRLKLPWFRKKKEASSQQGAGGSKQEAVDKKQDTGIGALPLPVASPVSNIPSSSGKQKESKKQTGILYKLFNKLNASPDEHLETKKELFNIEPGKGITGNLAFAQLNISGNKSIAVNCGNAAYIDKARRDKKEAPPISSTGFSINQVLNVKLNGVVNDRIHVNVDYNDQNGQERRTVNVDYKGSETAAISEVNFGDVNLSDISSPNARFVSSNKQVFGVRAKGKYKKQYDVAMVMSKTKGKTTTQVLSKKDRKATEMAHTSFTKYKYYQLIPRQKGKKNITIQGVYLDNRIDNNVERKIAATATIIPSMVMVDGTNTACNDNLTKFERLVNQKDYTIDENGILTINRSINESYCLGVVFTYGTQTYPATGSTGYSGDPEKPGSVWMIKPRSDLSGWINYDLFECKNIYGLSDLKAGDIGVEIVDKQGKSFFTNGTNTTSYARLFGLDNNADGFVDSAFIDYNRRLLIFPDDTPFNLIDSGSTQTNGFLNATATAMNTETLIKYSVSQMYKPNPDRTIISTEPTYNIKLSYKTSGRDAYMLQGWNIVENSEQILVNGKKMTRGIDYMVDYSSGFLTFFTNPPDNADIKAEYEYASFGAEQQKNLVGARMQYKPNDNFCFGSTLIYNGSPGSVDIPKISSSPESLQVFGVDTTVNLTALANKAFKMKKPLPFSISLEGELAASRLDVNTFGYAMIDSMEGVKETTIVSTHEDNWQIGSLPAGTATATRIRLKAENDHDGITCPYSEKEEIRLKDRNNKEKQEEEVLYLDYAPNPSQGGTWCTSVVSPLSRGAGAMDMREYTDMELWIKGTESVKIFVDLGIVSEDADGTGTVPMTEDKNKNGLLDRDEDIGWEFHDGTHTVMVGANNRKIDTEDLDGDGQISTQNHYFTLNLDQATDTTQGMGLNGFSRYAVSLGKAVMGDGDPRWELIKHVRIRIEGGTTTMPGQVRIGGVSLIKSRWSTGSITTTTDAATITVSSLNSQDDPDKYQSIKNEPDFDSLYPNKEITREEALVIKYDIPKQEIIGTTTKTAAGFVFRKFRQQNYNYYRDINFWLKNVSGTGTFFVRFGIDENNYIEYAFYLPDNNSWKKIGLNVLELKNKMVEIIKSKGTGSISSFDYATSTKIFNERPQVTRIMGKPELTNIQWLAMGIQNETNSSTKGEVWINELHLSGAEPISGDARRISIKTAYPGWGSLNLSNENIGGEFQRITDDKPSYNDTTLNSITLEFNKIKILPVTCSYEKKLEQTDPTKLNDILRSDFGSKTTVSRRIGISLKELGSLKMGTGAVLSYLKNKMCSLNINAAYNDNDINSQRQNDTSLKNSYTMSGDVNYKYTFPKKFFKIIPTGDLLVLSPVYKYSRTSNNEKYPFETIKDKEDNRITDDGKLSIDFTPFRQKGKDNTPGKIILSGNSDISLIQTRKQLTQAGTTSVANYQLDDRKFGVNIKNVKCDCLPGVSPKLETEVHFDESNFHNDVSGKRLKDLITSSRFVVSGDIKPKEWLKASPAPISGGLPEKPNLKYRLASMVTISSSFETKVNANYSNVDEGISIFEGMSKAYKDYYKSRLLKGIEAGEGTPGLLFGSGTNRSQSSTSRKFNLTSNWSIWKSLEKSSLGYVYSEEKSQTGVGMPASKNSTTYCIDMSVNVIQAILDIMVPKTVGTTSQTLPPRYAKYLGSSTTVGTKITKSHEEDMSQTPVRVSNNLEFNSNLRSQRLIGRINTTFSMGWVDKTSHKPNGLRDYNRTISPALEMRYKYDSAKSVGMFGKKLTLSRKLNTTCTISMNFVHNEIDSQLKENKWDFLTRFSNDYELQKNTTSSMGFEIGYTHNGLEDKKDFYYYKWNANVAFKF